MWKSKRNTGYQKMSEQSPMKSELFWAEVKERKKENIEEENSRRAKKKN